MAFKEQDSTDGWQTYSAWIDNLRQCSNILKDYDQNVAFRNKLGACTSNRQRFELVWNEPSIRQLLNNQCSKDYAHYDDRRKKGNSFKSIEESKKMREQGNVLFKSERKEEALRKYTEAVKLAPYPDSTCQDDSLAIALANRSATLFALNKYRLCLSDIDLALKFNYPEANRFKLLIRKVKCLHILSVWDNDVERIKSDLKNMLKNPGTKDYIRNEINVMFEFINQDVPDDMFRCESDTEDENEVKVSNASKSLPQAADCVEMSFDPDKGRYLLTNKDVSFGRLLIAEDPFVCSLAPFKRSDHCYRCFERIHFCGLCCPDCTHVLYCSLECLESNGPVHKFECNRFLDFQEKLGVAYLAAHIMYKINFNTDNVLVHNKKSTEEKSADEVIGIPNSNWPDLVYCSDYASVLSLMDHAENYDYDSMMGFSLTSAYMITLFSEYMPSTKKNTLATEESQIVIGSILLRHLLQLQTNLIAILTTNGDDLVVRGTDVGDVTEKPIGVGLYPTISLMNHSCQPNIMTTFFRNKFVIRAATGLECGTELKYCYGPNYTRMSKKDRQQHLLEQYFFTCNCYCCSRGKEDRSRALVCTYCMGDVIYNMDMTHECLDCLEKNFMDVKRILLRVRELDSDSKRLRDRRSIDHHRKIAKLESIESELCDLINWRNPIFETVKRWKKNWALDAEDFEAAYKFCKERIEYRDKIHGEGSFESVTSKTELIHINWQRLYYKIEESANESTKQQAIAELKALVSETIGVRTKLRELLNATGIRGAESTFDQEFAFLNRTSSNITKYLAGLEQPDPES